MKKGRMGKIAWFGMITVLLMALLLPMTVVLAETPTQVSVVKTSVGTDEALGQSYQHHSFYAEGRLWIFYMQDSPSYRIVYTSSADGITWKSAAAVIEYECTYGDGCSKNGSMFDLWYDYTDGNIDFCVVNTSDEDKPIYYRRGVPVSDGTITWNGTWQIAVAGEAGNRFWTPVIAVNTSNNPAIAYTVTDGSNFNVNLSVSSTANGSWTSTTDSPIGNCSNSSDHTLWGSIIPVTNGNFSLTYLTGPTTDSLTLSHVYAGVLDGNWSYYDRDFVSATDFAFANSYYYDTVHAATTNNSDDVFIVYTDDGADILFNWRDNGSAWDHEVTVDTGTYYPSLALRNASKDMVLSALKINTVLPEALYSADFDFATLTWGTVTKVYDGDYDVSSDTKIMSSYQNGSPLSTQWTDYDIALTASLISGCYGCDATVTPAASTDPGTTVMQIIIPLLVAITVVVLALKGIGEVNTVNAIVILMVATLIGTITFFIIKQLVLGI
jgi:hypothetical protein